MNNLRFGKVETSDDSPGIIHRQTGAILVGEWFVETPARQQATMESFVAALRDIPWPEGLLSTTVLASSDGTVVLNLGQWTSIDAYKTFTETHRRSIAEKVDGAVPGIQRKPAVSYRLYRSGVRENAATPGCIVIVSIEFDGPDQSRQQEWIDSVFDAVNSDPTLPSGGVSAHFLVSTDGTRVLNYAEWIDETSHQKALEAGVGSAGSGPKWQKVRNFPGLKSGGFRRYRSGLSVIAPQTEAAVSYA